MNLSKVKSIRPFVGSKNYSVSRAFYKAIGFEELEIMQNMCYFHIEDFGFYLQDAYVKDWIDNTMLFLELEQPEHFLKTLENLNLPERFKGVKLSKMEIRDWGKVFFLHDPSGILWQIGDFK